MKVFLKVLAFVILIDLVYMGIGQTLTQVEVHPTPKQVITADNNVEELISMGKLLVEGKGGCVLCHKIAETGNDRGPDLRGVGGRAATQKPGLGGEEYLMESLLDPDAFVVKDFEDEDGGSIMPPANKPPADMTPTEVKAIVAFLQSMGGEVTVRITPEDVTLAEEMEAKARSAAVVTSFSAIPGPGETLLTTKGCTVCHDITGEEGQEEGRLAPPLTSVAQRLTPEEIRKSVLEPDAVLAEGYQAGLMPKTFTVKDDPTYINDAQLNALVAYLSGEEKKGGPYYFLHLLVLLLLFNGLILGAMSWLSEPQKEEAAAVPAPAAQLSTPCPICEGSMHVGEPLTRCQSCGALHHSACWTDGDGCTACASPVSAGGSDA